MIYLHLGKPKTGTTTIQKYLSANAKVLLAEEYLYPFAGRVLAGHHDIYFDLAKSPRYIGKSGGVDNLYFCLLYTSPSPRDATLSRMPSSA